MEVTKPSTEPPSYFLDPVTYDVMEDPVVCTDGHTYDRSSADRLDKSPFTRQPVKVAVDNIDVRGAIFERYPELARKYSASYRTRPTTIAPPLPSDIASERALMPAARHGMYIYSDGSRYEGDCIDGIPNGVGSIFGSDGSLYCGSVKDHRLEGLGTLVGPPQCRTVTVGHFHNGRAEGPGQIFFPNGALFRGILRNSERVQGEYIDRKGVYRGPFQGTKRYGDGVEVRDGKRFAVKHENGLQVFQQFIGFEAQESME